MILNRNLIYELTLGDPLRTPEGGDNNVQVPNIVLPVVLALRPTTNVTSPIALFENSAVANGSFTRTFAAAFTNNILTLVPGLWEVEISMSSWFNYNKAAGDFNGTAFVITYQGSTLNILQRFASINVSTVDYARLRILLTSNAILALSASATATGQSIDVSCFINAIRIL